MKILKLFVLLSLLAACDMPVLKAENSGNSKATNSENNSSQLNCPMKFASKNVCVEIAMEVDPSSSRYWWFEFRLYKIEDNKAIYVDLDSLAEASKEFAVDPFMSNMGHGSKDDGIQIAQVDNSSLFNEGSVYRVTGLDFIMRGDWDIRLLVGSKKDEGNGWYEWEIFEAVTFPVIVH